MYMFWENVNVFITGADGFVGSWITRELVEKGANVTILVRDLVPRSSLKLMPEVYSNLNSIVEGSITDYKLVERIFNEYEVEACFHLAAQAIVGAANRSPISTFESNIMGTWNVLEAARTSKLLEGIVIASSDKAYGDQEKLPYSEDMCLKGVHPYDVSKVCADLLAQSYHATYGLPLGITRCANIYGGGDLNFSRIIPGTIRSIYLDQDPIIRSDGTLVRDYIYVLDPVNGYITLGEMLNKRSIKGQAFNFGSNQPITVLELVEKLIKLYGKSHLKPNIIGKGKAFGEIEKQYLSSIKAKEELGWTPEHDLNTGLKKTIKWYEEYFNLNLQI
ncbi:MAG: GDP-mannose 4,6-dehydratase [Candidatus Hydrothermarchaeales archaeon]